MEVLANELGPRGIRVNTIGPDAVDTDMVTDPTTYGLFRPDPDEPTRADAEPAFVGLNPMGTAFVEPVHVASAELFLASDEALYGSGTPFAVDAGAAVV